MHPETSSRRFEENLSKREDRTALRTIVSTVAVAVGAGMGAVVGPVGQRNLQCGGAMKTAATASKGNTISTAPTSNST